MEAPYRSPPTVKLDGDRIRRIREEKSLTQLYVAEVAGVSVDTVSRWENNRTPAVKRENALALARALEVDLPDILEAEPPPPTGRAPAPRGWGRWAVAGALLFLGAAWALWRGLAPAGPGVDARRRLPAYTPPGSSVPVLLEVRSESREAFKVVVRETLPPGWEMLGATVAPDQGPDAGGTAKWILPIDGGAARIAYLVRSRQGAPEGTAFRFAGEVVPPGRRPGAAPIRGDARIDLEYVHWADQNGDFHISDAEVLDALERVEAAHALGMDASDLRNLWGAPEYLWDRSRGAFLPAARP